MSRVALVLFPFLLTLQPDSPVVFPPDAFLVLLHLSGEKLHQQLVGDRRQAASRKGIHDLLMNCLCGPVAHHHHMPEVGKYWRWELKRRKVYLLPLDDGANSLILLCRIMGKAGDIIICPMRCQRAACGKSFTFCMTLYSLFSHRNHKRLRRKALSVLNG